MVRFTSSPERLNVLLSRANNGRNMIGNIQALTKARRGCKLWSSSNVHMKINGNIYDGLHVVCDRHPAYQSILKTPADFENLCMSQWWLESAMVWVFHFHRAYATHLPTPVGHCYIAMCIGIL